MEDIAKEYGWPWDVRLADSPDRELATSRDAVIASGDAAVLDRCGAWISLTAAVVPVVAPAAWILDLGVAAT
jgi:hypothetical protein